MAHPSPIYLYLLILWAGLSSCAFVAWGGDLLLDNFNTGTTGSLPGAWTSVTSGGAVSIQNVPAATNKSVRLDKTGSANAASVTRGFLPTSGKVAVELRVRVDSAAGANSLLEVASSNGTVAVSVAFNGGTLSATNGAGTATIQTYTTGTWYLLRLEIDTTSDTYDFYVDGVRKLTAAGLKSPVADIAKISCGIGAGSTGVAYVDGINIYTMEISSETGAYLAAENFNEQATGAAPPGWTTVSTGGAVTVQEIPFRADKSLRLQKAGSANAVQAATAFGPATGRVTVDLKARIEDTSDSQTIAELRDSNGIVAVAVAFDESTITATSGANSVSVATSVKTGTWYAVRLVLNTATDKYDLYVDAKRVLTAASFRNNVANIASFAGGIEAGNGGTMYLDNLRIWTAATLIGSPPAPVFDVASYGATGNGSTKDTAAIQAAIDACAGSGGSVYLHDGTFLSSTIELKSGMTLFIDSSAVLRGSGTDADYANLPVPLTGGVDNIGLETKRALIFLRAASNVKIDGGGRIEGNGGNWNNSDVANRPVLILPAMTNSLTIRNLYLEEAAMWCLVPVESRYLAIRNLNIYNSVHYNRDGMDVVDCRDLLVEDCTVFAEDDAICFKSGIRTGLQNVLVRDCFIAGSTRANGVKLGTRSYGQFKDVLVQDIFVKNTDKAAIALESVDGSDISEVVCRRIEMRATSSPFYLIIGKRGQHPSNDAQKIGSIKNIVFEDISGAGLKYNLGCPISGSILNGTEYPLQNLTFRRVNLTFPGGSSSIPGTPAEMGTQYPECNLWGNLPAWGYFLRHIDNLTFTDCVSAVSPTDARPSRTLVDVTSLRDATAARAGNLVITKVQYAPVAPSPAEITAGYTQAVDFAFVELQNIGAGWVDLGGAYFSQGLDFDFTDFLPVHLLSAGQRVLIVSNLAAFQFRYGTGLPVAGVFKNASALAAGGGQLRLMGSDDSVIADFTFANAAPWPAGLAGSGRSLVLLRPATNPDPANPANWRPSSTITGAPGADDRLSYTTWKSTAFLAADLGNNTVSGPDADPDKDGVPNLLEYLRGSNPRLADAGPMTGVDLKALTVEGVTSDYSVFNFRYRPAAEDVQVTPWSAPDFANWTTGALVFLGAASNGDGTVTVTYRSPLPRSQESARYFRLEAHSLP